RYLADFAEVEASASQRDNLDGVTAAANALATATERTPEDPEPARERAREALLERNRSGARQPSTFEAVFETVSEPDSTPGDERRSWLRPRVSARRDWLLIVERQLAGQSDAANRLAIARFGWVAPTLDGTPDDYVEERLVVIAKLKATQATDSIEYRLLTRLESRIEQLVEGGRPDLAAELLRQIPLSDR
ncbi:MAG: hypothetical protein KDB80_18550, partial [Planctomycetes bacterium]|nr:hypothetical protein [Planctomycetota bacterium]